MTKPIKPKTWKYVAEVVVTTDAPVAKTDLREAMEGFLTDVDVDRGYNDHAMITHVRVRSIDKD